ncbi:MAG: hypothetical protein AVDCRST_MAG24-1516, partial [uncultured Nocardioidaceae bacterium]
AAAAPAARGVAARRGAPPGPRLGATRAHRSLPGQRALRRRPGDDARARPGLRGAHQHCRRPRAHRPDPLGGRERRGRSL